MRTPQAACSGYPNRPETFRHRKYVLAITMLLVSLVAASGTVVYLYNSSRNTTSPWVTYVQSSVGRFLSLEARNPDCVKYGCYISGNFAFFTFGSANYTTPTVSVVNNFTFSYQVNLKSPGTYIASIGYNVNCPCSGRISCPAAPEPTYCSTEAFSIPANAPSFHQDLNC